MVLAALIAPLAFVSPASAANFFNCPGTHPPVDCVWVEITGGQFNVGNKVVPIVTPITLEGGLEEVTLAFYEAEPGNTLTKVPQTVFGAYTATLELANESGHPPPPPLTVNPAVELRPENLLSEEGVALRLPMYIKLNGPLLSNTCRIGPITLNLTTGTTSPPSPNNPIKGKAGELEIQGGGSLVILNNDTLVDNAFAEPKAAGCTPPLLANLIANSLFKLPRPAGENTIILDDRVELLG